MIQLGLIGYPLEHSLSPRFIMPPLELVGWKAAIPCSQFTPMMIKVYRICLPVFALAKLQD